MFHSYCFDFSVWEMYGALLHGGTLVIVPQEVTKDPALFLELLIRKRVTFLNQTPTAFYNLVKETLKRSKADLNLRYVVFGGEALNPIQLREWKHIYPEVRLVNMYGITETTVHVTFKEIVDRDIRENLSNIGGPIPQAAQRRCGSARDQLTLDCRRRVIAAAISAFERRVRFAWVGTRVARMALPATVSGPPTAMIAVFSASGHQPTGRSAPAERAEARLPAER